MADTNVDLSQDLGYSMVIPCLVLLPLTWISVALRTYARAVLTKSFKIDDWFMVIAQVIFTITCAMTLAGVSRGLGKHNAAVPNAADRVAALMWQAIATAIYILNMMFVKLSIGVFLLRLAVWTVYQWILWISLIIVTLWSLGIFIWDIFQCIPVAKQWDFRIEHGHCASPNAIISSTIALSVLTVGSDWLYAILPIPMMWNVKMTKQAKVTVIVILGLGIFASVATLIRLRYLGGLQQPEDLMYTASNAMLWTIVEPGVAIFASSLATIRPLLRLCKIRGFGSRTQSSRTLAGSADDRKMSTRQETCNFSDISLNEVIDTDPPGPPDAPANVGGLSLDMPSSPGACHKDVESGLRDESKGDVFAVEGNNNRQASWQSEDSAMPTVNEIDDLEAQSPHKSDFDLDLDDPRSFYEK
ncbi:hypothetical protein CDD83_111 [Cordyceps sp. RAO-2017]|nr:hypothetical protein CDD83_111 [Cordyceps sp. RAO-2017]